MPIFPSVEWFDALRELYNSDDIYRSAGGGSCDANVGVKVGEKVFVLTFEGFECSEAREAGEEDLEDVDFYMEMEPERWQEMIANIKENGHADIRHTLNTLDLGSEEALARTKTGDGYRLELFFRYNQTFQNFFDASTHIDTVFEASARPHQS